MTTRELFSRIEALEEDFSRNEFLLGILRYLSNRQTEVTDLHSKSLAITGVHETNNAVEVTRGKLRQAIAEIKSHSPQRIFAQVDDIVKSIEKTESRFDVDTSKRLNSLKNEFVAFGQAYEQFISAQQLGETAQLLSVAQRVDVAINSSIEFTSIVLRNVCPEAMTVTSPDERLEVYLSSEADFALFLEKVASLERIYEELCQLFKVSSKQEPLRIVKIESGSLWAWLKGSPTVVTGVRSVIEQAARYIYRNHTSEGKLSAIPKKVESIASVLHLADELKKRDISTDQLDEHIKKASVLIGNELEKLLVGEEQIELNGETIALTQSGQQKLIANKRIKLIEEKTPE